MRATRVKSEEFDGGDEEDEEILSRPTPMNVLVKSNTGLVPRNLCLKELHQVSRGEHKDLFFTALLPAWEIRVTRKLLNWLLTLSCYVVTMTSYALIYYIRLN